MKIKRVYDPSARGDGERILVDRLWPRGLSKRAAAVDEWMKDLGPSHELRRWFGHDPKRWIEFRRRYVAELKTQRDALAAVARKATRGAATLLFGARDAEHNQAMVLKGVIERLQKGARRARARRLTVEIQLTRAAPHPRASSTGDGSHRRRRPHREDLSERRCGPVWHRIWS